MNTEKFFHSVCSPSKSVHDCRFCLMCSNLMAVLYQLVKDIVLKVFRISGIWLELKCRRNML